MKRTKLTRKEKISISRNAKRLLRRMEARKIGLFIAISGLVFIVIFGKMWISRNEEIKINEVEAITITIEENIKKVYGRSAGYSLKIKSREYPNKLFRIGRFGTKACAVNELQNNVKINDELEIDILKDQVHDISESWNSNIFVYGIRDSKNEYLSLKGYNEEYKKDRNSPSAYLIIAFSLWMGGYGIYLWKINK